MRSRLRQQKIKRQRHCQPPLDAAALESELSQIHSMVEELSFTTSRLEATTLYRKVLSIERNPPIDTVIEAGVVTYLVNFIGRNDLPELQLEAAWALTNIASGTSEHTRAVVQANGATAVPMFVNILRSSLRSDDLKEQAIWALGNVAGDSTAYRNEILDLEAMKPLIALVLKFLGEFGVNSSKLRTAVRTLSNLCFGEPPPPFEKVKPALHILLELINLDDEEVLTSVCWALAYISDFTMHRIAESVMHYLGVLPRLVELLDKFPSLELSVPTLRIVGNLVTGDDSQTERVLRDGKGILSHLRNFLEYPDSRTIRKEACWIISNITAGSRRQIQDVIKGKIIDQLVEITQTKESLEVSKEAVWAISNAVLGGSRKQIESLVTKHCIESLYDFLDCTDPRTVKVCLEGLERILKVDKDRLDSVNLYKERIEDCDGLTNIKNLQNHENHEISAKAARIWKKYWDWEEGEEQNQQHGLAELNPPDDLNFG